MANQKIIVSNRILIKKPVLHSKDLMKAFTIINPAYQNSKRFGKAGFPPKKHLVFWESTSKGIYIPRGALKKVREFYRKRNTPCNVITRTREAPKTEFSFIGELKPEQQKIKKVLKKQNGIIKAPTGVGKTVMALWIAAQLKQPTIVLVHTRALLEQWPKRVQQFLGVKKVGIIGDGKLDLQPITIATVQTLVKHPELMQGFGCMFIDECHKAPCDTYLKCIQQYKGRYLYGLSATPKRTDGKTSIMKWAIGGIICSFDLDKARLTPCFYKIVPTQYTSKVSVKSKYAEAIKILARNKERNELIIKTILEHIEYFGIHLIISQSRAHCLKLITMLPKHLQTTCELLTGKVGKKERKQIVERAEKGKLKFLFATDKLIGEGFDEPLLSLIHLTCPIKSDVRLIQYVGRIRRKHPKKVECLVIDYFDGHEPIFHNSGKFRCKYYAKNKIERRR